MNAVPLRLWKCIIACLTLPILLAPNSSGTDRKEIVRQARAAYYNLESEGMSGFRCQVAPDWESIFRRIKQDDLDRSDVMPILRQVRFEVVKNPNRMVTVSRQSDAVTPNELERVRPVIDNIEQLLTGFFQVWQGFEIGHPIPKAESEYRLEDLGEKLTLTFHLEDTDFHVLMDRNYAVSKLTVNTGQVSNSIYPKFILHENQYVLSGYDFDDPLPSGENQRGSYMVQNQNVDGLILPARLSVRLMVESTLFEPVFDFTDYQVKKR